jgi:hypothetical protein
VAVATLMHDGLAARPWAVEVITADDLLGEAALCLVESIVDGAILLGATPEEAVHLYRQICREEVFGRLDPETHPRLTALGGRWPQLTSQDTYVEGLRALVDGALPLHAREG